MSSQKIVFYDGDCGFCNRSVNFILKNDKTKTIQFAMLQSDYTKETFIKNGWESADLSTFYFYENEILYERSTAALRLTKYFKYPQRFLVVFYGIPVVVRDFVYNFIAKRRKRLYKDYCVVPSDEEKNRFIS